MGKYADFTRYADETGARLSDQPRLFEVTSHFDVSQQELFDYVTDFDRLSEWIWASTDTTIFHVEPQPRGDGRGV